MLTTSRYVAIAVGAVLGLGCVQGASAAVPSFVLLASRANNY